MDAEHHQPPRGSKSRLSLGLPIPRPRAIANLGQEPKPQVNNLHPKKVLRIPKEVAYSTIGYLYTLELISAVAPYPTLVGPATWEAGHPSGCHPFQIHLCWTLEAGGLLQHRRIQSSL